MSLLLWLTGSGPWQIRNGWAVARHSRFLFFSEFPVFLLRHAVSYDAEVTLRDPQPCGDSPARHDTAAWRLVSALSCCWHKVAPATRQSNVHHRSGLSFCTRPFPPRDSSHARTCTCVFLVDAGRGGPASRGRTNSSASRSSRSKSGAPEDPIFIAVSVARGCRTRGPFLPSPTPGDC